MTKTTQDEPGSQVRKARSAALKALANAVFMMLLGGVLLFVSAGTLKIPMFWVYLIVQFLYVLVVVVPNAYRDPDMMEERLGSSRRTPKKGKHRAWHWANRIVPRLVFVVAGLDVGRFHWSDTVPFWLQVTGLVGSLVFISVTNWGIRVNTYFSNVVRVQEERGHQVITIGPYRYVRHPGYVGMVGWYLMSALALNSWAAFFGPGLATVFLYVIRTRMEEDLLRQELDGYEEYATRVPYRWVPGVW